jgi:hypothetical protein
MLTSFLRFLKLLILSVIFISLVSCSRVSQNNFEKIKPNMTMQEVVMILGEPTSSESINIVGVSGTNAIWKSNNAEINIQFLNEKVLAKTYSKTNDDQEKTQK